MYAAKAQMPSFSLQPAQMGRLKNRDTSFRRSAFLHCWEGWAPRSVPGVYAAKAQEALGRIQVQLQARPSVFGRLPLVHKLLLHSLAW